MRPIRAFFFAVALLLPLAAVAGDAEVKAAQGAIEAQLRAFQAGESELAYSFAAPNIKRIFPTVETFMGMVESGYRPVRDPKNFAFGKVQEMGAGSIVQQVLLTGPGRQGIRSALHARTAARRRLPHHWRQPEGIQRTKHMMRR